MYGLPSQIALITGVLFYQKLRSKCQHLKLHMQVTNPEQRLRML